MVSDAHYPEVLRWLGKLRALYMRHQRLVEELSRRGYRHRSELEKRFATGNPRQNRFVDTYRKQPQILRRKKCECRH